MVTSTDDGPVFFAKKIGGLVLVILGFLAMAAGVNMESTGLVVFGTLVLVAGAVLLVLKIVRRNENSQLR
jgi:hypothetical protein